jgi:hypothetical protein
LLWCPNFARTTLLTLCLLSPWCSSFLPFDMILFSFSIHFVSDPWVSGCCLLRAAFILLFTACSWFHIPSFLAIPLFKSLYDVCIYYFIWCCMLYRSISCMRNLPTKWTLHLASRPFAYTDMSRVDTPKYPFVPPHPRKYYLLDRISVGYWCTALCLRPNRRALAR